jgi:hypothetical protein
MKTEYNWRDMSDCAFLLIPFNIRYCALKYLPAGRLRQSFSAGRLNIFQKAT